MLQFVYNGIGLSLGTGANLIGKAFGDGDYYKDFSNTDLADMSNNYGQKYAIAGLRGSSILGTVFNPSLFNGDTELKQDEKNKGKI